MGSQKITVDHSTKAGFKPPTPDRLGESFVDPPRPLRMNPEFDWIVQPVFAAPFPLRITATVETEESQQWTGKPGNIANYWRLTGYDEVIIDIKVDHGDGFKPTPVRYMRRPMPSPDPTIRLQVSDQSRRWFTVVNFFPVKRV